MSHDRSILYHTQWTVGPWVALLFPPKAAAPQYMYLAPKPAADRSRVENQRRPHPAILTEPTVYLHCRNGGHQISVKVRSRLLLRTDSCILLPDTTGVTCRLE